jgi:hypothetical protein
VGHGGSGGKGGSGFGLGMSEQSVKSREIDMKQYKSAYRAYGKPVQAKTRVPCRKS